MRIFITGASGFVGAHLTRIALAAGAQILALAQPADPLARIADVVQDIEVLRGDLADREKMYEQLAIFRPTAALHMAWYGEPGKYLYSPLNTALLKQSLDLLETLIAVGCKHTVMVGTCAEYDTSSIGVLREASPTHPETIYAAAKLSLSLMGQHMANGAGMNFAWARLFYLYGPGEHERRLIPALIRALHQGETFPATKGEQVRDYLHVEDVARALWHLTEQQLNGVFNVCSGEPITIRKLMETVEAVVERPGLIEFGALPYRQWEPMSIVGDNSKLRAAGWQPRYTLREGLTQTVEWWTWQADR